MSIQDDTTTIAATTIANVTPEQAAKIKEVVCEILEVDEDEVTETSLFIDDHEADSLRAIEILASLEKAFGVVIDQAELPRMVNLRGVNTVLAEAAGW
ncbi:acyl carrier protein [Actinokineospora sp. G85]|uniref:acyl carrier protein n=1 Tax=Actinokineospora sp. G85 TaxID=3406626 RepID=UPI003C789100